MVRLDGGGAPHEPVRMPYGYRNARTISRVGPKRGSDAREWLCLGHMRVMRPTGCPGPVGPGKRTGWYGLVARETFIWNHPPVCLGDRISRTHTGSLVSGPYRVRELLEFFM